MGEVLLLRVGDIGREGLDIIEQLLREMGEPLHSGFAPTDVEALIESCGLTVIKHPTAEHLRARYSV